MPLAPGWCWACICCQVSTLSPPQLWQGSSAEPQPRFCVVSLYPHVPPLPCSALLSHPRLALGDLDLPRVVPAAQGWWCQSLCVLSRGGEAGGVVGELCAMAGLPPLHSPCSALAGPSPLWDPCRGCWWRRGHSVPWWLHIPCHSAEHSRSSCRCVVGGGCWGSCLASPVCVFMMLLPGSGKCLLLPLCFQQC